jgi:hypothetical protein
MSTVGKLALRCPLFTEVVEQPDKCPIYPRRAKRMSCRAGSRHLLLFRTIATLPFDNQGIAAAFPQPQNCARIDFGSLAIYRAARANAARARPFWTNDQRKR